jgi:hypothetical protein
MAFTESRNLRLLPLLLLFLDSDWLEFPRPPVCRAYAGVTMALHAPLMGYTPHHHDLR